MGTSGHTPDRAVARLAGRQHQVVSRAQLLEAGLTAKAIVVRVRRGQLFRRHFAVYAVGTDRLTAEGEWLAGVLACGPGAVLGRESAAALWGIGPRLILPVHVIVRGQQRRSRPGLVVHRSRTLTAADVTERLSIPVTTPLRTIRDLPAAQRADARIKARVLRLIDDADLSALTAPVPLLRSTIERRFLALVADLHPEVNAVLEGHERDFVWPEHRLVVEIDGPHHRDPEQRRRDLARDRGLIRSGWQVMRADPDDLAEAARDVRAIVALSRRRAAAAPRAATRAS